MAQVKMDRETARRLAREIFHNTIVDHIRTSIAPSEKFIDDCFDSNLTVGETLRLWANRHS